MSKLWTAPASLAFATLALLGQATGQDGELTPTETIKLLEEVETIGDNLHLKRSGTHAISITAFKAGTASPTAAYEFYLDCHKLVQFDRKGLSGTDFREWKSRNVKELRSRPHAEARRLQLSFLVLTLRAAQIKEAEDRYGMGAELLALADKCIEHYGEAGRHRRIMHEGAVGSMYGQAYDLASTLQGFGDWPGAPLDLEGIYENVVLPPFRTPEKADELGAIWDRRMQQHVRMVAALENPEREAEFQKVELPRYRWQKHVDLIRAGQSKSSVRLMVEMIQLHLDHPDVDEWLSALQGYLSGELELPVYGADAEEDE